MPSSFKLDPTHFLLDVAGMSSDEIGRFIVELCRGWVSGEVTGDSLSAEGLRSQLAPSRQPSKISGFQKPTFEQVVAKMRELGAGEQMARLFYDHYEANGWRVGKTTMKRWEAACSGWVTRAKGDPRQSHLFAPSFRDLFDQGHVEPGDPINDPFA